MSRKLAKENYILVVIIIALVVIPITASGNKKIVTAQRIIVIDPGHGGIKNGLVTSNGLKEKTIALNLAVKTAQKLENRYNVFLTRTRDVDISPEERIFTANKKSADLFVCIHLHSSSESACLLYYFDLPEPHKQSILTAENTWKKQSLLHQSESKKILDSFLNVFSVHKKTKQFFIKGIPLIPLEGASMPAILIEPFSILFLSHNPDVMENVLDEYAILISKSIDLYFRK